MLFQDCFIEAFEHKKSSFDKLLTIKGAIALFAKAPHKSFLQFDNIVPDTLIYSMYLPINPPLINCSCNH